MQNKTSLESIVNEKNLKNECIDKIKELSTKDFLNELIKFSIEERRQAYYRLLKDYLALPKTNILYIDLTDRLCDLSNFILNNPYGFDEAYFWNNLSKDSGNFIKELFVKALWINRHTKSINDITFMQYKDMIISYMVLEEIRIHVKKGKQVYEIEISDKDATILTMYLDNHKQINVIEHGFIAITKANKEMVINTAKFIGKNIIDIDQYVDYIL